MKLYRVDFKVLPLHSFSVNHSYKQLGSLCSLKIAADNFYDALARFEKLVEGDIEIIEIAYLEDC